MTNKDSIETTGSFDHLLTWLSPDREQPGERYEEIRRRLIKSFAHYGCWEAEDLADETLRRVEFRVCDVAQDWMNDPALYFYAVVCDVRREYLGSKPVRIRPYQSLTGDSMSARKQFGARVSLPRSAPAIDWRM